MILFAVFLIGFSTLAFEVLLTRIFSITQWNHLSFMVISIALFGFAASGTFLSIFISLRESRPRSVSIRQTTAFWVTMYAVTTLLSFAAVANLPLDYFRLPVEPAQSLYLLSAFILLSLPFFSAGALMAYAYTRVPQHTGLIYFAAMSGSACGAVFPALLLPFINEGRLVVWVALFPLLAIPAALVRLPKTGVEKAGSLSKRLGATLLSAAVFAGGLFLLHPLGQRWIEVKPSPYKTLSHVLQYPQTRIQTTVNTIRGRTERVDSPYIRFAPGLSLRYMENLVPQSAVYKDGDNQLVLYPPKNRRSVRFAAYTLGYSGYALHPGARKALIVLKNGGSAVACALFAGIRDTVFITENPGLADMISQHYGLAVDCRPPRSFLSATDQLYDIIQLENWGTSIPGSSALNQDHLFTSDAFVQYIKHLTPEGLIIISRKLLLPPAGLLRLWATAYESLKQMSAAEPVRHLAVLRNWDTFVLLVSRQPLQAPHRLKRFADERNFDIVFMADMTSVQANRYNQFDEPYHFNEINRLSSAYSEGQQEAYFNSYLLDVRPQSDNRPFPGRYLKWPRVKDLYQTMGSRLYALLMSGEIVIMVVFIEALAISALLLFVPLFFVRRRIRKPSRAQVLFFIGVGAGFMFVELFFIKKLILLWEDPVIGFSVVITGVLIFSSLGGAWAQRRNKHILKPALWILIGALLMVFFALDPLLTRLLQLTAVWQYSLAVLVLGPIGFLMGLPFTIGMRDALSSGAQRAYAWSANGCASVLASIAAAQIALMSGIAFILGCGVAAYTIVLLSWRQMNKS